MTVLVRVGGCAGYGKSWRREKGLECRFHLFFAPLAPCRGHMFEFIIRLQGTEDRMLLKCRRLSLGRWFVIGGQAEASRHCFEFRVLLPLPPPRRASFQIHLLCIGPNLVMMPSNFCSWNLSLCLGPGSGDVLQSSSDLSDHSPVG
jgi:hypothetical protein